MRRMRIVLLAILMVALANGMPERGHYYVDIPWDNHTEQGLYDLIGNSIFTVEYRAGVFDCSDMTAYLDWFLKSHGFCTYICLTNGKTPDHCWLAVKVNTSTVQDIVYVESTATPIQIIERGNILYSKYQDEYKHYDNLWDVLVMLDENEIDWWRNVPEIPANSTMTIKLNNSMDMISETSFPSLGQET